MLLTKLIAKQRELGLLDADFAARLGVPRSTWQLARSGKVRMGARLARAAAVAFPELREDAALFLLSDAKFIADPAGLEARSIA